MANQEIVLKTDNNTKDIGKALTGKYLTFKVGNEEFGIQILSVNQIIRMQTVTTIPRTPPFVRGVINLRGRVIPIIDLRRKFKMAECADTDHTCIVVIEVRSEGQKLLMGVVIDEVREVREVPADSIEQTPSFGQDIETEFIMGVCKVNKTVVMLLDIDKILTGEEKLALENVGNG